MKYIDQVIDNYSGNWEKAAGEIDTSINDLYTVIDTILKENTFPEEQVTKWTTLLATASTKAEELKLKMEEKYKQMTDKATYFDDIVAAVNAKGGTEFNLNTTVSSDQLTKTEEWWILDSAVAAITYGEGYPYVFYHENTIRRTRTSVDENWSYGRTTVTDGFKIIKNDADLETIPGFTRG